MSAGQRVFLVDGQAVYLEGDGELTEDVLQQALSQLSSGGQVVQPVEPEPEPETKPEEQAAADSEDVMINIDDAGEDEEEGVLAILQDENGQQQTVRLTPDQAAALGIDYQQLVAAAAAGGEAAESADPVPAEQSSAQEVASLASSVVLNLNESQPSLVNQSEGGDKVTYTFEVVDKEAASGSGSGQEQKQETGLLAKSRDIMVPRVKTGEARQIQQQIHKTAAQVLHTNTPSAPVPRDPVTGGIISSSKLKRGPAYNTGSNALQSGRQTVINTASTVQKPGQSTSSTASAAATVTGDPAVVDMEEDVDDLPVILTPMNGSEELPDFIEPRPGLKILVRPLEMAEGAAGDGAPGRTAAAPAAGRAVGSSENPIQLVQQGNTFKSLQPLSKEQLKQIATVLQQSRLNVPSNSKNSLYDADTNTRIVYRVVYPEDVAARGRGRGRRGRPRGRGYTRQRYDSDVDWSPQLSKYEKAERKRLATKTRTGRVSKPPKHMIKNYRRIHRLDFDEPDLDDSDGGYSEYDETADTEDLDGTDIDNDASATGEPSAAAGAGAEAGAAGPLEPDPSLEQPRPKRQLAQALRDRFSCRTCHMLCIGYNRLESHFLKYPDHERPVYVPPKGGIVRKPHGRPMWHRPYGSRARGRGRGMGRGPGRPPSAKRPRLEDEPGVPLLSPDDVMSQLVRLSGGSVEKLCDSMSAVLEQFRYHVRASVTPTPAGGKPPTSTSDQQMSDGPVLEIDEERASLTGLPRGTYVLWPTPQAASNAGESMSGDVGEVPSESPAAADPASSTASPSAAAALGEAVMAAVSEEGSRPPSAGATEQGLVDEIKEEAKSPPAETAEVGENEPSSPADEDASHSPEADAEPESGSKSPPAGEKDVLSAAEISQMALSATEGTQMPAAADVPPVQFPTAESGGAELASEPPPAPLPATNGRTLPLSESEAAHRAVSDVLGEFVDGLVDTPEYTFSGEAVSDVDQAQIQLKMADSESTGQTAGEMPLLGDER